MTNTKAYRETKAALVGKTEQELANMLSDLGRKAASQSERASRTTMHRYFAVEDTLKAGWGR